MKLRDARDSGDLEQNPRRFRAEATVVLNYLEGIATGESQGFYNRAIVKDHMEPIIRDHVSEFLEPGMAGRMELDTTGFERVRALISKWDNERPHFRF